jgi:membrane protein implicated in regulation of membrane protease activity
MLLIAAVVIAVLAGPSLWTILLIVVAALVEVGEFLLGLRFTRRRRERRLVGRRGRMRAEGVAEIAGELWQASGAASGETVEVVAVAGRTLRVKPVAAGHDEER